MSDSLESLTDIAELSPQQLRELVASLNAAEILDAWDALDDTDSLRVFLALAPERQAETLASLSTANQERLLQAMSTGHLEELIGEMEPDDLVDILQNVDADLRREVWETLGAEERREMLFLLRFDEDDAAGLMTPRYLSIQRNVTVGQALRFVRRNAESVEIVSFVYVVDRLQRLRGVVSLKVLLATADEVPLVEIIDADPVRVEEETDQEDVARTLETHDLAAVPVTDPSGKLLGIVTFDDVIDVIREEHTEDVYRMGGMGGVSTPYMDTSIFGLVKKRFPWLVLLLLLGTVTTNVLHHYEGVIIGAAFLFIFMPVITQTGGNSGGQSSTLMVRGLATGEIHFRDFLKISFREILVGAILGLGTGLVIFLRSLLLPPGVDVFQAAAIAVSLVFVVLFATIVGAVAPLIIHRLGYDPTVMSAPLMATLIDVCGITIYFEIAKLILGMS